MTKSQFLGLRKQGFTLKFVNYGEDIKAKVNSTFADATYKKGGFVNYGKIIKVKTVNFGEDVKLSESAFPDFNAE